MDSFTRFLWLRGMPNKKSETVLEAFKIINEEIKSKKEKIYSLCTDRGKEFLNHHFQSYLKSENIQHRLPKTLGHCPTAEVKMFFARYKNKVFCY